MEGMYWKRGLDALKAQYKRWRYFKTRRRGRRRVCVSFYELHGLKQRALVAAKRRSGSCYSDEETINEKWGIKIGLF